MAINKVWIDKDCTGCGFCEGFCPEVFELKDLANVIEGIKYSDYEEKVKKAAVICPVETIKYI